MDQPPKTAGKAFYVLLCAILGVLLFVIIQRAVSLIYYLLLNANSAYSLGLNYYQLSWINLLTFAAAVFGGAWYGVWLGLHWYDLVYEQGRGGLFHGFRSHWRHPEGVLPKPQPTAAPGVRPNIKIADKAEKPQARWDLDDLMKKDDKPKVAAGKVTVKRRPAAAKRPNGVA